MKYKCLKCGTYYDDSFDFTEHYCSHCGYPNDYIIHLSRLTSLEIEKEILQETEKMVGAEHCNITYEGCFGDTSMIKKILKLTDYQAEMLQSWILGIASSI